MLKPNTILMGFLSDTGAESCDRYVGIIRSIISLDKVVMIIKGLSNFPSINERLHGTIDVYWVIHDGGVLTLISHLLRRHHVWRNCKLRIFAVAQMNDNSVEMKSNLVQSLHRLRIDAECEVLEIGDFDVSQYAYEKTMMLRSREEFLKKIEDVRISIFHQQYLAKHTKLSVVFKADPKRKRRFGITRIRASAQG